MASSERYRKPLGSAGRWMLLYTLLMAQVFETLGSAALPDDCGLSRGCFSLCPSRSACDFFVTWTESGSNGVYTLATTTTSATPWIAVGLSSDDIMGSDSVIGCGANPSGNVVLFSARTTGKSPPTQFDDSEVSLGASSFTDGVLSCTFTRPIAASANGQRFDISEKWTLLFAYGSASFSNGGQDISLSYHGTRRYISSSAYSISDIVNDGGSNLDNPLIKANNALPDDCGLNRGCFSLCPSRSACDFFVTWTESGSNGVYTLATTTTSATPWMAVGLSSDDKMGSDSVIGCGANPSGNVVLFSARTTGKSPPTQFDDSEVSLGASSFTDGVLSCTFTRPIAASANGQRFDISKKWTLLFAYGSASFSNGGQDISLSYHGTRRYISSSAYSISDIVNDGGNNLDDPLIKANNALPDDCGLSRGCFSLCPSRSACDFFVTWTESGSNGGYTLATTTTSATPWMAVGLSSDDKMGSDSVIGCGANPSGNVVLFSARTTGKSPPTQFDDSEVSLGASSFTDGVLSCTFTRPIAASANGQRFDISEKWTLLFAYGSASISNGGQDISLSYHGTSRYVSSSAYSISDIVNDGASNLEYPLIKVHGSLMIGAWIFFASIGIVVARYFKPVWTVSMFSQKVWFQIHRTCMVLVLCCTAAGFILIFVEVEEWSDLAEPDDYLNAHPIMGVVVTGLTVLNPLMALIRPHPGTKNRPLFNWAHWFVGTGAHILGVITIFFGVQLAKADGPDYLVYILAGYVGWQVLVGLTLELLQCSGRKKPRETAYELQNRNAPKTTSPLGDETAQTLTIKRIILVLHVFVVGSISAVLIAIIAVGETELND